MTNQKGFTLIELLIVVAIIGILSAMVIPNLLDAADRARQRATIGDMRTWGVALAAYFGELNSYPPIQPINAVQDDLVPFAVSALNTLDHWKHPFVYTTNVTDTYTIRSTGKDGAIGLGVTPGSFNYDLDLILNDGVFVNAPG